MQKGGKSDWGSVGKRACKPDSVQWPCGQSDNHSSRLKIALQLKPPTRALGEHRWRPKAPARLFGVAPSGVYLASLVTKSAGVSYTSGSPLPVKVSFPSAVCFLLHFPSLSTLLPKLYNAWPLASTVLTGVRTFLSLILRQRLSGALSESKCRPIPIKNQSFTQ